MQRFEASTGDLQTGVQYGYTTVPHLAGVEIVGPYNIAGSGNSPSRARIFVCTPVSASAEPACAKKIISTLARRAYETNAVLTGVYDFDERDYGALFRAWIRAIPPQGALLF